MIISGELAKWFVEQSARLAVYVRGDKAPCILCGTASPVTATIDSKYGLRRHKCPTCGKTFQSREMVSEAEEQPNEELPSVTSPDAADKSSKTLLKQNHKKSKK